MIVEACEIAKSEPIECDVCLVGAGIAGISLARDLEKLGLNVLLLESGGERPTPETDALSDGDSNLPDYPFDISRARSFGGTSSIWTGACVQMDDADYESRSWVPHSGWPIKATDLTAYFEKGREVFGLPGHNQLNHDLANTPFSSETLTAKLIAYSTPQQIGDRFRPDIEMSASITCVLNATVTKLKLASSGDRIEALEAKTLSGTTLEIQARCVVLTAGGLENARLLLASNTVATAGVGNTHDTVGRYHMEHPIRSAGTLSIGKAYRQFLPYTNFTKRSGVETHGTFGVSAKCRAEHELLDMHVRVYRYSKLEEAHSVVNGKALAENGVKAPDFFEYAAKTNVRLATEVVPYVGWHLWNKVHRTAGFDHVRFRAFIEQEPDPDNRISLSERKDSLGVPLAKLTYTESARMKDSMRRSLALMSQDFEDRGIGKMSFEASETEHLQVYDAYGYHQMGSTRMSDDPKQGVVDADCRVHGIGNLFIAGCSVFPTGGAANPTWTIVALALRLSEHIKGSFQDLPV